MVAAGLGASIVAARAARYHDRRGIAFVPFRDGPTLDYGVLCPTSGHTPPVVSDYAANPKFDTPLVGSIGRWIARPLS